MNNQNSHKGMLALEMLLFLPLAALLTFVAIDLALYITDHGLVSDALRSGLNSYKSYKGRIISIDQTISSAQLDCAFLEHIESTTIKKFELAKGIEPTDRMNYSLRTSALFSVFDPQTGDRTDQRIIDSDNCSNLQSQGNLPQSSLLLDELNNARQNNPSMIALKASTISKASSPSYFSPYLLQIFIQIQTTSRSINPYMTALLMDKLYQVRSEDMVAVDSNWILNH